MFKKLLLITIFSVFFLIFIGSVVRSTGAGMGCPDWPKCFGKIVPPMSESELPPNYLKLYKDIRIKKNHRLEILFTFFGLKSVLQDKLSNHTTYNEVKYDFNKAWIEYLNRLIGVVVGLQVLAVFLFSFTFIKSKYSVIVLSFFALIILLLEAFLGSVVVSTNLFPELISVHLVLALILVFLLIYIYFSLYFIPIDKKVVPKSVFILSGFVLFTSFVQLFLGVNVREVVDTLHNEFLIYDNIIPMLGIKFYIHRSFSLFILVLNLYMVYKISKFGLSNPWSRLILPIIFLEILTGIILSYWDLPSFSQPFHLLLASFLIGMQFLNFLYLKFVSNI